MNKAALIEVVASKTKLTKKQIEEVLETMIRSPSQSASRTR